MHFKFQILCFISFFIEIKDKSPSHTWTDKGAGAILYSVIPDLHDSQLVIDDTYDILEWRRVSYRKLNYDDLTSSSILFDDPRQNLMDLINDDGDGALSHQENEPTRPIIRFSDDELGTNMNNTSGKYIWSLS